MARVQAVELQHDVPESANCAGDIQYAMWQVFDSQASQRRSVI